MQIVVRCRVILVTVASFLVCISTSDMSESFVVLERSAREHELRKLKHSEFAAMISTLTANPLHKPVAQYLQVEFVGPASVQSVPHVLDRDVIHFIGHRGLRVNRSEPELNAGDILTFDVECQPLQQLRALHIELALAKLFGEVV